MRYTPVKQRLSLFFNQHTWLRLLFYRFLDLLLLRAWYIHRALKEWGHNKRNKSLHILDAGAGFGQYAYFLANMSSRWNVLAVDMKSDYVCSCNRFFHKNNKQNILYRKEDLRSFVVPNNFDLILSVDVVEQIKEDEQVLENFYQSLKKGGLALLSVPSDKGGSGVHKDGDTCFCDEQIRSGYNIEEMKNKLKKIGFKKVEGQYTYGKPGSLSWKLSMKYPMMLLGISRFFFPILPLYYILVYPFCFVLNIFDLNREHAEGTGILIKAYK